MEALQIETLQKGFQNIAGIEIPFLDKIVFKNFVYSLEDTPPWVDLALQECHALKKAHLEFSFAKKRHEILLTEFRAISIRVNLFEKVLIPKTLENIRKIKVYLDDAMLAEVSRAKVAKSLLEKKGCG